MEFFRGENRGNQAGGFGLFAGLSTAPIGPEIIATKIITNRLV